jgi:hypothetical protein
LRARRTVESAWRLGVIRADFLGCPSALTAAFSRRAWTLLAILMGVAWFANLDVRKLQHPDEGRYAEIAREMVATGDWVTPRLNGIKYFEKPPLQYWLTAARFRAFEVDEWPARLPAALAGFLERRQVRGHVRAEHDQVGVLEDLRPRACTRRLRLAVRHRSSGHARRVADLLAAAALGAFLLAEHWRDDPRRQRNWMLVAWAASRAAS